MLLPVNSLPEADSQGQWLLDRFTSTYLDQWRTESLCREWNYIHSQESAPCSVAEMRLRVLTIDELSKIMAERLASTRRHHPSVTTQLVLPAVKFIEEGRRLEAVALFRASVLIEPDSAESHNNLGFCLMPDDPEQALSHFEEATRHGWPNLSLSEANRVLCLLKLGRRTSALDLATEFVSKEPRPVGRTWLWDPESILDDHEPRLTEYDDVMEYVRGLIQLIRQ